jgi:cystine transport system ATP-binding protein
VLENIIEGPVIVKGEPKDEATARARELLAKVGLAGKETSYPRRLSGGSSNAWRLPARWRCALM